MNLGVWEVKYKKCKGIINRALAGILVVGMVLTGMPASVVEAANELPGETQPGQEISVPGNPGDNPGEEGMQPGEGNNGPGETEPGSEESMPGENQPGSGTDEPGDTQPGGGETMPGEEQPGGGTDEPGDTQPGGGETMPGEEQPGGGTEEPGDIKPGGGETMPGDTKPDEGNDGSEDQNPPGDGQETEVPDGETKPGEEEPVEGEDSLDTIFNIQVSGNDISGNDLMAYEEEMEEGNRVVGGYIELPEDRDVSVVDESAPVYGYDDEIAPLLENPLPSEYIPEKGTLPLTRSQSPYGTCWAHSSMALAEIDMMRNGGAASSVDYSELHLAYFSYGGEVNDPLGGLEGDSNTCAEANFLNQGGNLALSQYVLVNWVGAADESIAPYSQAETALKSGLDKELAFTDVAHLQNSFMVSLQDNRDIAKRMIQKYGALGTSYCDSNQFYNATYKSYYCNIPNSTNHAVTIVGWDDSFSADQFSTKPEGDGAWLIRNSWQAGGDADSRGRNSYFWMSYYDKSLAAGYAFDFEDAENYHHNYQYDGSMKTTAWYYKTDSVYGANVFTANGYEKGERLEAVGVAFYKAQTSCTISIYKNLTDLTNPESGELIEEATTESKCICEGFYTIPLEAPVSLAKGDTFSVVVRYSAPETEPNIAYLPCEGSSNTWFRCVVAAKEGQSFYKSSPDGAWVDFGKAKNANLRIKAYTLDDDGGTGLPTRIELGDEVKEKVEVGVGDSCQASCTVLPRSASDRTVRWESGDTSIATVDEKGLITGVSAGTTTITVTCNADTSVYASFLVEVYSDLRSIQIIGDFRVAAGETLALETVRSPSSVAASDVQWSSSDERVLTVDDNGVVTGVAPGYAVITAGIGSVTATKRITCEFPAFSYRYGTSIEGITLTWTTGSGAKSYQIYRAEGDSWQNPRLVSTVTPDGGSTCSYLDQNVTGDNEYIYEVKAIVNYINGNSVEEKAYSCMYRHIITMPAYYSITYHLNGGENNGSNPTFYRAGYAYNYIYNPKQRPGYSFTGWYYDEGMTEKFGSGYLPTDRTGNLNLYAGWSLVVYQITYRLDDGTNPADQITSYTIETDTFTLREPTKVGSLFDGWYKDSAFTQPVTEIEKGSTGNRTLYAKWVVNGKRITYNLNGGTNSAKNPSSYTDADGTVNLQNPIRKGYVFQGWYTESTYENRIYSLSPDRVKGDLTLYAKWSLKTYNITYTDGGTHDNPTTYTIEMPDITLKGAVKSGYQFAGWYTDINRTTPIVEIKTDTCANMTIYAKWELIYSITYFLEGGVNDPDNPLSYVESDEITLAHPVREGYVFGGWYTDRAFTKPISVIKGRRGKLTLYAKWENTSQKITYELDGGKNSPNNPSGYTSATDFVLEAPEKDGYDFQGWYTDSLFKNRITRIADSTTTGVDMTLYAKWSIHTYRITYMVYGGTNSNPETYTINDAVIILEDAVKEGAVFEGWYSDFRYQQKVTQIRPEDMSDITLFAKWQGEEAPAITAIQIKAPTRTTYRTGEKLDISGGEVTCVSDIFVATIPMRADMISGFDSSGQGICHVTVSFEEQTADFDTLIVEEPQLQALYGQKLSELTLPENGHGIYSWADADLNLNREGVWNVPVSFTPNDQEAFQRLDDLYAHITVEGSPADDALETGVLTLESESFVYTGMEQKPEVTLRVKGVLLAEGQDYTLTYYNNIDAGMATVVASGMGDYHGSISYPFEILPARIWIWAKDKTILVGDRVPGQRDYEYEVSGLLMNDRLISKPVFRCGVTEAGTQKAGRFTITPSDADAGPNYTITYGEGVLTVSSEYLVHKVVFDVQGHGTAPRALYDVKAGSTIDPPKEPSASGYVFKGWCKDASCTQDWDFEADIVQSDITLYAKWAKKSAQAGSQFQMQEIEDIYYYTGKAWKPSVNVYDGETILKAGRDYTVKYFNNINANADGVWKKGSGQGADFNPDIPYVQITGKGNYTEEVKVNFDIRPAVIADKAGNPAEKVVLKYTDQFVAANKVLKPFGSVKYSKAMKLNRDYILMLTAVDVRDGDGEAVKSGTSFENAAIPREHEGRFMLTVKGTGNYEGSISRSVYVTDKNHLMKNAKITLGKNQKNIELVGESVELTPSVENSADTFTVKLGTTVLTPGDDYKVSYLDESNRRVGKATLVITGIGEYSGTKTATFTVKGKTFTARKVTVTGVEDKVYTGRAITQNDAVLVYDAGGPDERELKYGTDYTVSYAKNINKGTAIMTFTGLGKAGFNGSFKERFQIAADDIESVKRGWNKIVVAYSKAGAEPVSEIVLTNDSGIRLKNGKDYTLRYKNNKLVADAGDAKAPTITVKGKGNYQGTFSIPFTITGADLGSKIKSGEITVKSTAVPYQPNKPGDYEYKPAIKLMEGKTALRPGADYTVTYINNTQAHYQAYIDSLGKRGTRAPAPQAIIEAGSDNTYLTNSGLDPVPLTIYRNKLTKANLGVEIKESECVYTGAQVKPEVVVCYKGETGEIDLKEGIDFTVSYGANVKSGKKAGSLTISGMGATYGGDVTVKFEITRKKINY